MSLLKRKPAIQVGPLGLVERGRPFDFVVNIEAAEETPVERIEARLVIWQPGPATLANKLQLSLRSFGPRMVRTEIDRTVLCDKRMLPAGVTELRGKLIVPHSAPPALKGSSVVCEHLIVVRVHIPWWPDAKTELVVPVADVAPPVRSPEPAACRGDDMEVELSDRFIAPAATITGHVTLGNIDHLERLEIELVVRETYFCVHCGDRQVGRTPLTAVSLPWPPQGLPLSFELTAPDDLREPYVSEDWSYGYEVMVRAVRQGLLRRSHLVPVALEWGHTGAQPPARAPVAGGPWIVAAQRKRKYSVAGTGLRGDLGARGRVSMSPLYGLEEFVSAALEYRSLGLGLRVRPGRQGVLFGEEVPFTSEPAWNQAHRIEARELEQAVALGQAISRALLSVGKLVEMTDTCARFEIAIEGPLTVEDLVTSADRLETLARAIDSARLRLPVPAPLRALEAGWRSLAEALDAPLEPGDVHVIAPYRRQHVLVGVLWRDGKPQGTRFHVSSHPFPFVPVDLHEPTEDDRAKLSAAARDGLDALASTGRVLIADDQVALEVDAPFQGTERTLRLLDVLVQLQELRTTASAGPYR